MFASDNWKIYYKYLLPLCFHITESVVASHQTTITEVRTKIAKFLRYTYTIIDYRVHNDSVIMIVSTRLGTYYCITYSVSLLCNE